MAKLRSYYGLCPLIDHSSFLGVSEDLKQGCVNVTLGKNIVIKYKLSDQKQISSWSTKDGLTSAVVYDKIGKRYAAAFAQNQLRVWEHQEVNLDKVRKRKVPIHTIIAQTKGEPLVIFKNGTCCSLSYALENRKTVRETVLKDNETIQDQAIINANNQTFVSYVVQSGLNRSCLVMEVNNDNYVELPTDVKMRIIVRKDAKVRCIGSTFVLNEGLSQLLTIWSDGRLYSMSLFSNESEQSPGVFLSAISVLSPKTAIVMSPLSSNYIAMYGADSNQEGASIIIYNLQFKIVQSSQRFKLFGKNAKLIVIGNSILLAAGQSIAVIPFNLETEQLATIVGSQKTNDLIEDDIKIISEMEVVSWDAHKSGNMTNGVSHDIRNIPKDTPNSIKPLLKELSSEGLAEGLIAEHIIPFVLNLKCINTLTWCIGYFKDFPDHLLLKVLHFGLTVDDAVFPRTTDYETESTLKPSGRRHFVNKVLNISFSDVTLLPCLRKHLSFTDTITLLHHLKFLLIDNCNDCVGELTIVEWISILLDAHYQEYLLVHDESIVELLHDLRKVVCDSIVCLRDIKPLLAFLTRLQEGKTVATGPNYEASKWYSIEQIKLY